MSTLSIGSYTVKIAKGKIMEILRTPEKCFENLKDYSFEPHYTTIKTHDDTDLRIHHIDVGPKEGPIILCMHGQPVWRMFNSSRKT